MLDLIVWALFFAVVGFVYAYKLTQPGMLLVGWYNWLNHLIGPASGDVLAGKKGRAQWLFKPLIGCYDCVTGQVALWGYLVVFWEHYNLMHHLVVVCLSLYFIKFVAHYGK